MVMATMCGENGLAKDWCFQFLLVVLLSVGMLPARAVAADELTMVCPYDGVKFTFAAQMSGMLYDSTLDLMPVRDVESPPPLAVCPSNGFVFAKEKYSEAELEHLRPLILSPEYQALKEETPYYRAAWIARRSGAARVEVFALLLAASWEAEEWKGPGKRGGVLTQPPQSEANERYRRYAGEFLEHLKTGIFDDKEEANPNRFHRLLKGETLRRLSRFQDADNEFVALAAERDVDPGLRAAVAFERKLIAQRDSRIHLASEIDY